MTIHHVEVEPIGASHFDALDFRGHTTEISREQGWGKEHGMHRATMARIHPPGKLGLACPRLPCTLTGGRVSTRPVVITMKSIFIPLCCWGLLAPAVSHAQSTRPSAPMLVPLPVSVVPGEGAFILKANTGIIAPAAEAKPVAAALAAWLRPATGLALGISDGTGGAGGSPGPMIRLELDTALTGKYGREGYTLDGTPGGVVIRAAAPAGLFYGAQTFRQLLPPEIFRQSKVTGMEWSAPAVKIEDRPRFVWRGFSLDVSRHFFPFDYLKQQIDHMAAQKLNLLQLHLTDDDGWRIEIKQFPKLTETGAWRGTDCALPNTRKGETHKRYGGFYTQEQLKELVAYARARHIEIMPEIDLPGHALAIVTAYPETLPDKLAEGVSAQGHSANAISAAKESNYVMIDKIIGEVASVFPFAYIHIGGDEVNHKVWEACPETRELMQREKLNNLHEVQVHFTRRLEGILRKHDKKMIGWQEIAHPKLDKQTGIMAWIGPEPGWNAAKRGSPAVMAPGGSCYFDMACPGGEDEPPSHWWAGQVGLDRAYGFDPLSPKAGLDEAAAANVLGVHAALWTEFVTGWQSKSGWLTLKDEAACADYKIWPRLCATAETGWTPQARRDYAGFALRMGGEFARMAEAGRIFRLEPPSAVLANGKINLKPGYGGGKIKFTVDGSDPFNSPSAKLWDGKPIDGRHRAGLAMRAVLAGSPDVLSPLARGAAIAPAGSWNVAGWAKDAVKSLDYPVAEQCAAHGRYRVTLQKTGGPDGLVVESMALRSGGKDLATSTTIKNNSTVLAINEAVPANLQLVVTAKFTGDKAEAKGTVLIEKLAGEVIPGLTIVTTIPGYTDDHQSTALLDGDPSTYFWSSRELAADESLTWVFANPIDLKAVELQTGAPNGTKDQLVDGVLELSTDGVTFTKASGFTYGAAKADLGGKSIKAIRVRATSKSPGWVIIQDLVLRR